MKVLHFSTPLSWRGGEQQLLYLVEEMLSRAESLVVCPRNSLLAHHCNKFRIPADFIKHRNPFDPRTIIEFNRIVKKFKPQIIHLHDPDAHAIAAIWSKFTSRKVPMVLSRKVDFPLRDNAFTRFKYNLPEIEAIVCVSKAIQKIIEPAISKPEKISVIYDGIDLKRFQTFQNPILREGFKIPDDHLIVANIAAIVPHKDYTTFVKTAEILIQKGVKAKYFIIGDGPQKDMISEMVTNRGLAEHFLITGFRSDIERIFPEVDVFFHPSETEGLGSSILDAFVCNATVVATRAGGIAEIVEHNKTGLLAEVRDAEQLAKHIEFLSQHPEERKRLSQNAFEYVQQFDKARFAEKHLILYSKIVRKITGRSSG